MDDLISRAAAIEWCLEGLNNMPSAEPDLQQTCNKLATDCISRRAAIDAIKTWGLIDGLSEGQAIEILADEEKLPSVQPEVLACGNGELNARLWHSEGLYVDGFNDGYRERQSEEQQWIPCSERLPKEDGRYLITEKYLFGDHLYVGIANYGVPMMPMNKGKGRGWFITDSEGDYYCDMNYVLAWMPLPEPYKERREE